MTSRTTASQTEENPAVIVLGIAAILAGGGWLLYRHMKKTGTNPLSAIDIPTATAVGIATTLALITGIHLWTSTHPGPASELEPEKWSLTMPANAAVTAVAATVFASFLAAARWLLGVPLIPAGGIALASAVAAAGFTAEPARLRRDRTALRTTLIQALYAPLGHKAPSTRVVPTIKWESKTVLPQTVTIRAGRPMSVTAMDDNHLPDLDDKKGIGRPDPSVTMRRALRTHCNAQYRITQEPSALVFTATHFIPEQIDDDLADLTRKVRDIFESTATVYGDSVHGFTIKHTIAKKLTGDFRKRVAEQNLTELVGGTWRVTWDMPASSVTFAPKPVLPFPLLTKPIEPVRSIAQAIKEYSKTRFPFGVDLDLGIQEWDPLDSPHTLVSGKTGAGKTVYLRNLIIMAALRGWAVVLVDFKGGSYSDFVGWPNVHIISSDPFESIATIHRMYKLMDERNARARWDQSQWEGNLPYLVIVDEASQFKVVLERMWANLKPAKNAPKECPTITELGELARLARSSRVHLVLGMQRPGHELIDTDARDNFGNRVSVGPISRIAAEMLWDDSYIGRYVPRIKGRGMSTGTHQDPRETQYYFTPAVNSTKPEEAEIIATLRPPVTLVPRYVPELPPMIDGVTWSDIADAQWFPLSERPDLDPTQYFRKVTHFDGDSRLGFDVAEIIADAEKQDMQQIRVAPADLAPCDVVVFGDGRSGEVDGIDIADDGTVTVMWQDTEDSRLLISTLDPNDLVSVQRSSS